MMDLMWLYGIIIIMLLAMNLYLFHYWMQEHSVLMSIISHSLVEIKKKLKG